MPLKPVRRNYNCSDADLKAAADQIANCATRDIADFAAYDIDSDGITAFQATITNFFNKTTDDESLGDQKTETDAKNSLRKDIEDTLRLVRTAAQLKYGGQGKYRKFGFDGFSNLSDNDFVRMVRRVVRVLNELAAEMAASFPSVAEKINMLTTKGDAFDDAVDQIIDKKNARDIATQNRIIAGNNVYAGLFKLSSIGKALYQDTNEAKYNDYVLGFQGTSPGASEGPVNSKIEGTITNSITNAPLFGVKISAIVDDITFTAYSDEDGKYAVEISVIGNCTFLCELDGYTPYFQESITLVKGQTIPLDVQLLTYTQVVGRITDAATHNPIEGARAKAQPTNDHTLSISIGTDSLGNYSLPLAPRNYTFNASKPGYTDVNLAAFDLAPGQTVIKDIQMVAQAVIKGHIQTQVPGGGSSGGPIAGANIVAEKQGVSGVVFTTTTDGNGDYYLAVNAGSYRVTVSKTGFQTASVTFVDVAAGQTATSSFALAPQP